MLVCMLLEDVAATSTAETSAFANPDWRVQKEDSFMMITFHVAAANGDGDSHIPKMKHSLDWCANLDDSYDRARLQQALNVELISCGSDDSDNCLVMGATILEEFHAQTSKIKGVDIKEVYKTMPKDAKGSERKLYKKRYAFVRIRITDCADGNVKVSVTYQNPKGIPGESIVFAKDLALYLVQISMAVSHEYETNGSTCHLRVVDHPSQPGVVKAAIADNERRKLKAKRRSCKHKQCDKLCVMSPDGEPPEFSCRCHCNGKCLEVEDDWFEE